MKALRRFVIGIAVVIGLLAIGLGSIALYFDSARLKEELARVVLEKKQRILRIDGELSLTFWPGLGIRLGAASLSEPGSETVFATLDSARASLQWLPLLSKRIVVNDLEIAGVRATLLRDKNGRLNIADLLVPDQEPGTLKFDVAAIHLANGQLAWRDETSGQDITFDEFELRTGRVADVATGKLEISGRLRTARTPADDLQLRLAAQYAIDRTRQRYAANRLEATTTGQLAGMQGLELVLRAAAIEAGPGRTTPGEITLSGFSLLARGRHADGSFSIALGTPQLLFGAGKLGAQQLTLTLDADKADGGTLHGTLDSPLSADLTAETRALVLEPFAGEFALAHPRLAVKPLKLPIRGSLRADLARQSATGNFASQLDDSRLAAQFSIERYAPLALGFAITIDKLDADRYLAQPERGARPAAKTDSASAEKEIELTALKKLDLHGTLHIGTLRISGVTTRNLRLDIRTADDNLASPRAQSTR